MSCHLNKLWRLNRAYIIIQTRLELKPYHSDANIYTNMTLPQLIRRSKPRKRKKMNEKKSSTHSAFSLVLRTRELSVQLLGSEMYGDFVFGSTGDRLLEALWKG